MLNQVTLTMLKSALFTIALLLFITSSASAQDEGAISKKARVISKATTLYLTGGPSCRFAGNSGDYSGGLTFQAGLLKRFNRVVSIGPFVSFTKFDYDKSISDSWNNPDAEGNNVWWDPGLYEVKITYFKGGDLQFYSVGADVRFNIIPSERVKKFSAYAIAKPYLLISKRSAVSGTAEYWGNDLATDDRSTWYYTGTTDPLSYDAETELTGGMNVGVIGEYIMPSGLSLFLQSMMGFTLPITYMNTSSFPTTHEAYYSDDFPFAKKSFSTLTVSLGVAYTF